MLLELVLEHHIPRVVFSSTAALYGDPERTPIEESDPLRPTNPYGESKLLVERMLEWFHRIHGLRYASLRYFNAAGATEQLGEAHNPETPLSLLCSTRQQGSAKRFQSLAPTIRTVDGSCVRDYIHVADLAAAHLLAFDRLGKSSHRPPRPQSTRAQPSTPASTTSPNSTSLEGPSVNIIVQALRSTFTGIIVIITE